MSVKYIVRYEGTPRNPALFRERYATEHAGILRRFPGIGSLTLWSPVPWRDPFPVNPGGASLVAVMDFADAAALDRALASDARAEAREDFRHFPPFEGKVFHQAMAAEKVF